MTDRPELPTTEALLDTVQDEMRGVLGAVDTASLDTLATVLLRARRVFVAGEGRSGFMARAFAMRLMHLGLPVHVIGETTTPAVGAGDTVVAVSGSGTTAGTVRVAEQAVKGRRRRARRDHRAGLPARLPGRHRPAAARRDEVPPRR
ncbi:SIS domain-containing protein [Streptomyces sp. CA-132043]|uniref:SIS domain-containing protein n=1 Tax=Streptomyces sp. CA-132043 TaxID=3240048 RepID=UPI003D8B0148